MRKAKKTYTSDNKMLELIGKLKDTKQIKSQKEFCDTIGFLPQNLANIRNGVNHFTPEHIENVVRNYKVNANWLFGVENEMFLDKKKQHYKNVVFSSN